MAPPRPGAVAQPLNPLTGGPPRATLAVTLVVDVANVMGSRPDGWWRDRAGAATRLLAELDALVGREVAGPDGAVLVVAELVAVIEGAARAAADPAPARLRVARAAADGDSTVVEEAVTAAAAGRSAVVVSADRGLRARLPASVRAAGPRWVLGLLG